MTAGWLLEGLTAALLIGVAATLGWHLAHRRPGFGNRLVFDAGSTVLATTLADVLGRGLADVLLPLVTFVTTYVAAQLVMHAVRRRLSGFRSRWLHDTALSIAILVASMAVARFLASVWVQPHWAPWLALLPAIRVGMLAGSLTTRRRLRERRQRQRPVPERVRDHAASALAATLPEGTPGGHLWRTEALSRAMADRLGTDGNESRLLSHASLLHHAGRLAYEDRSVDIHPSVNERTVEQLGFDSEVCRILEHARERWNGTGPLRLRGEYISRAGRILAVADRYDQLAHGNGGTRSHSMTMALLRSESDGRFDPLMFEILEDLSERLESTGADMTRQDAPSEPYGRARLVLGEHDLRTLYSIERATALPIGRHERLTLVAGLLRTIVPFDRLAVDVPGSATFRYGDRKGSGEQRIVALNDGQRHVGTLRLTGKVLCDSQIERLDRVGASIAAMLAREDGCRHEGNHTDPETGLPNARFLRRRLEQRMPGGRHVPAKFGLIAVHVRRLARLERIHGRDWSRRYLLEIARRLAQACDRVETLVRLGPDQFIVLTGESRGGELVRRWHDLVEEVSGTNVAIDSYVEAIQLDAAHAAHPLEGNSLEDLLATLESRLTGRVAGVVPFPNRHVG
jgi:GGDEF domain-containing protein